MSLQAPKRGAPDATAETNDRTRGETMTIRRIITGLAASIVVIATGGLAQAQIKIVFNSFAPPTFVFNQGMIDVWAKKVAQVTEGRVVVEIPATSLAPPQQQWEMVTQGVADGAYIFNGFALKRLLLPQLAHLPFATPTSEAQARALWRTQKKFFEPAKEYEGVELIGYFGSPAPYLWAANNQKPFMSIDDLKGIKTWSPPGDNARALEKMGAVIVSGPAVRSYEIISKGIVQAWGGHNFDGSYAFNVAQFADAVTVIPGGIGSASFSIFINKDKWASIPKKDQDLIMSVSGEELAKLNRVYDEKEVKSRARMKAEGKVKVLEASDSLMAELRKQWAFLEDEWIANANSRNIDGKAALQYFKDQVKELSR
jgi:TRAP-type C4-dicarboxylate transport system substrate-binding protein